jgi:hypothetical protein
MISRVVNAVIQGRPSVFSEPNERLVIGTFSPLRFRFGNSLISKLQRKKNVYQIEKESDSKSHPQHNQFHRHSDCHCQPYQYHLSVSDRDAQRPRESLSGHLHLHHFSLDYDVRRRHRNIANEVTYFATDEHRQNIPWVRIKDRQGNITDYLMEGAEVTTEQIEKTPKRRVDCVECHNRPSHIYIAPDRAVNEAFVTGRLDTSLPYLKREAVAALDKPYQTTSEALSAIKSGLENFYQSNYSDSYAARKDSIDRAVVEVQRIFQTYFFPEMKVNWQTHPDNIGHFYSVGCFRCHDGKHKSNTGKVISTDCNICHTVLDQSNGGVAISLKDGNFRHPVELGDLKGLSCTVCHRGNRAFQHPVNLGDISEFKCTDCHAGKLHTGGE